jgi:hypothetical protein
MDCLPLKAEGGKQVKGCKNCPAFAKCTLTYRGPGCVALRSTYGVETDPEIITNADRIRAMDDNELAEFLSTKLNDDFYGCPDLILQWLQQSAEEE